MMYLHLYPYMLEFGWFNVHNNLFSSKQGIPEAIAEKNNVIGQLRSQIKTKELIIEQLEEETKEMQQALEDKVQNLQKEVAEKEEQLQYKVSYHGGRYYLLCPP